MSLQFLIAAITCAFLAWRLYLARQVMKQLIHSARTSEPVIHSRHGMIGRDSMLDKLVEEFNGLLAEKANIRGAGEAYHEQVQALLGNLREAVVMVDQNNLIHSVNPVLLELTGSSGDPLGKRLDSLIQGTQFQQFIRDVRISGAGQQTEIEVRIKEASRWLEVSAAPLNDKSKRGNQYTLFIFHDITRQKRLEKMRTEFVANVSHELRTPVTVIKGFAETLLEDDNLLTQDEKQRFLQKICNNSDRLHRLVEDLMLLTRLESTEMILLLERFSLNEFLDEVLESLSSSNQDPSPELILHKGADVEMNADPMRLTQVLSNLVQNARSHAKGATEIHIASELTGGEVRLSVTDNGAGIPAKDLPHIFQRFYRVDKGRSRDSGGTGLGLSIVKHIIARHGGTIHAQSTSGKGTRIECRLPVDAALKPSLFK